MGRRPESQDRLIALAVCLVVVAVVLLFANQPTPPKPVKDGVGPLAVQMAPNITAPTTHSPLEWWQAYHPNVVNNGDLREQDCLYCHDVTKSCNNCHGYVGAKLVVSSPSFAHRQDAKDAKASLFSDGWHPE